MRDYRPDRVVKVLTTIVTIAYFGLFASSALLLIGVPAAKLFAGNDRDFQLSLRAGMPDTRLAAETRWGPAEIELGDAYGSLKLPVAVMPWWFVGLMWMHLTGLSGLLLLSVHHLRRVFQRVRAGAPFDGQNAVRLRWVGLLLIALSVFDGVAQLALSLIVGARLADGYTYGLRINVPVVLVALVLVALAEIFRRGAELENEQALVV